jgi:hypothetical protein
MRGQSVFNSRARQVVRYDEMLAAVAQVTDEARAPVFVVTGKRDAALLPAPDVRAPVMLNGTEAQALVYGWDGVIAPRTTTGALLSELAGAYQVVGDPFCGYGRAGQIFAAAGRGFVMSDYNASCIGYVALHASRWWPA